MEPRRKLGRIPPVDDENSQSRHQRRDNPEQEFVKGEGAHEGNPKDIENWKAEP